MNATTDTRQYDHPLVFDATGYDINIGDIVWVESAGIGGVVRDITPEWVTVQTGDDDGGDYAADDLTVDTTYDDPRIDAAQDGLS